MSQENVDRLREGYEAVNRDGPKAILDLFDPDFESEGAQMETLSGITIRGREGVEKWFEAITETWDDFRFKPEEFIDIDEHLVVVVVRLTMRGEGKRYRDRSAKRSRMDGARG